MHQRLEYAAIAVVFITATIWGMLFLQDRTNDSALNTLYVPAGQRAQITLQDGTCVWLERSIDIDLSFPFFRG